MGKHTAKEKLIMLILTNRERGGVHQTVIAQRDFYLLHSHDSTAL